MLTQQDYNTHNHVKYLINYHFVFIPKRRKRVLVGEVATRIRQIFALISRREKLGYSSPRGSTRPRSLIC
jgi:REP element-mobilizing transposase RayT